MNKKFQIIKYIFFDFLSAAVAWAALFFVRKIQLEGNVFVDVNQVYNDTNFWVGVTLLPVAWICFYALQGTYKDVFRKGRLKELQQTVAASVIGVLVIFFAFMLDDQLATYKYYYLSFLFLLLVHFVLTYLCRLCLTNQIVKRVHNRQIGYPTLLVGSTEKAYQTYLDLENQEVYSGNQFLGFVSVGGAVDPRLSAVMPHLGATDDIVTLIEKHHIEEVIIAVENFENEDLQWIIRKLSCQSDVIIKIPPELRDIIFGSVKITSIFHSPLITLNPRLMEEWQYSVKRVVDVFVSSLALVVLSPVYLITSVIVKCTSPGPVFYAQERVGLYGRPFKIYKFRSMYIDAEAHGPALSSDNDPRITPFGRFMRKVRLDEIPQFYNVLVGTMSLVGPRPERQFFIDQIVERAPEYLLLQKIKPGITSWGQVKFGYAENVDEMVERLRYDLLYIENMSFATDIKIMLYTIIIIVQGRGK